MPFRSPIKSKTPPPEETFEEAAYLKSLGEKQALVSIKLEGGDVVHGWIEYYDRDMLRLTREGEPNLFIFKSQILYIEEGEGKATRARRGKSAPPRAESANND
jgi:host factor-I protein